MLAWHCRDKSKRVYKCLGGRERECDVLVVHTGLQRSSAFNCCRLNEIFLPFMPLSCKKTAVNSLISFFYGQIGEEWMNEDCTTHCFCTETGMQCQDYSCPQKSTCKVKNGIRNCYCPPGYSMKNGACQRGTTWRYFAVDMVTDT